MIDFRWPKELKTRQCSNPFSINLGYDHKFVPCIVNGSREALRSLSPEANPVKNIGDEWINANMWGNGAVVIISICLWISHIESAGDKPKGSQTKRFKTMRDVKKQMYLFRIF